MITLTAFACDFVPQPDEAPRVVVNPAHIVRFYDVKQSYGGDYTRIETVGHHFNVEETTDEILRLIAASPAQPERGE